MTVASIKGEIVNDTKALPLPNSKGESCTRVKIEGLDKADRYYFAVKDKVSCFNRSRHAPIQVGRKIVFLNINSAAKRLSLDPSIVRQACEDGAFGSLVETEAKKVRDLAAKQLALPALAKITDSKQACIEYLDQSIVDKGPTKSDEEILTELEKYVSLKDANTLQTYIKANLETWKAENKSVFVHSSDQVPRSIQYDPRNGSVFIHFNRSKQKEDKRLGTGAYKDYKRTFHYQTGKVYARGVALLQKSDRESKKELPRQIAINNHSHISEEVEAHRILQDTPGVIPTYSIMEYRGVDGASKVAFIQELADGSLEEFLEEGTTFTSEQVHDIAHQLLQTTHHIHSKGISHWDLHAKNILISIDPDTKKVKVFISDLGLARQEDPNRCSDISVLGILFDKLYKSSNKATYPTELIGQMRLRQMKQKQMTAEQALEYFEKNIPRPSAAV